ncbi:MAG: exo-alpha-sialidase [Clostridia bacterium]|nr:exo-alpha-sialidase [Clostridia bacterium]
MNRIKLVHLDSLSCEAIFRIAPNGDYVIISQVGDVTEPAPQNRVHLFRSTDKGESWSKGESIYPEDGRAVYLTEVAVNGQDMYVFAQIHDGAFLDWDCVVLHSADSGYTWENLGRVPCFERSFVFIRSAIRLKNGAIMLSYHNYEVSEEENERLKREGKLIVHADLESVETGTIVSYDEGKTFEKCKKPFIIPLSTPEGKRLWQWTEPTLMELKDGRIVMLIRINGTGYLWRSESCDGGMSWSEPVRTDIPGPNNKPKLIRLPDGKIALLNTPNSKLGLRQRYPLTVWISDDELESFSYKRVIADMPGAYSYSDGVPSPDGKHILFAFEFNRHDIYFVDHEIET